MFDSRKGPALRDLETAVSRGTTEPNAYIVLAVEAMDQDDWELAIEFCYRGLKVASAPQKQAMINEILAIAKYAAHQNPGEALELIERALQIDPLNARLLRYRSNLTSGTRNSISLAWDDPNVSPTLRKISRELFELPQMLPPIGRSNIAVGTAALTV
jgi:tetratricopeptide (TPR) repeat protein